MIKSGGAFCLRVLISFQYHTNVISYCFFYFMWNGFLYLPSKNQRPNSILPIRKKISGIHPTTTTRAATP